MAPEPEERIQVEVVYATPRRQELVSLTVSAGCTVAEAIDRSGLKAQFPELRLDSAAVGIFSRKVSMEQVLQEGDRVEIYRPLIADPREARRRRASSEGVTKRGRGGS
jgi:putative ubiquitin-RnfH superfamily antitoxin RatB of RatAB toxin-antitoxin module